MVSDNVVGGRLSRRSVHTAVGVAVIGRARGLALRQGDRGGVLEAAGRSQRGNGADGNEASDEVHVGRVFGESKRRTMERVCVGENEDAVGCAPPTPVGEREEKRTYRAFRV